MASSIEEQNGKYDRSESLTRDTNSKKATKTPAATRSTFPLPAELRNRIFEHLLLAERASVEPTFRQKQDNNNKSKVQALAFRPYRFSTNALAVNKQMRHEAGAILYRQNEFVMIEHNSTALEEVLLDLVLPTVAEASSNTSTLKGSCILGLQLTNLVKPKSLQRKAGKIVSKKFIMLLRDLPKLCSALQLFFSSMRRLVTNIIPASGSWPERKMPSTHDGSLRLVISDLATSLTIPLTSARLKNEVFGSFQICRAGGLDISFRGFFGPQAIFARDLQHLVQIDTVWLNAALWDLVETTKKVVEEVRELCDCRKHRAVIVLVNAHQSNWLHWIQSHSWMLGPARQHPQTAEPFHRWTILLLDLSTVKVASLFALGRYVEHEDSASVLMFCDSVLRDCSLLPIVNLARPRSAPRPRHAHLGFLWCAAISGLMIEGDHSCPNGSSELYELERASNRLDEMSKIPGSDPRFKAQSAFLAGLYRTSMVCSISLRLTERRLTSSRTRAPSLRSTIAARTFATV